MYWATKHAVAEACYNNNNEIGDLIGTAFVARDMMQLVDAIEDDGLLRYWGKLFDNRLTVGVDLELTYDGYRLFIWYNSGHDGRSNIPRSRK
jgi:hypothetical protein